MMRKALWFLAGISLSTNLSAINIDLADLPSDIQDCHTAGTCIAVLSSFADVPNPGSLDANGTYNPFSMNAFQVFYPGDGRLDVLARYTLVTPSAEQIEDTVQSYTGSVWLQVGTQFAPDVSTATLYLDHVDPMPAHFFPGDSDGSDLAFQLSAGALLGGSGYQSGGCCEEPSYTGNMSVLGDFGGYALAPCLADGCYSSARLNLLYLLFSDPDGDGVMQTDVNPFDDRGLLFEARSYDPYGGWDYIGSLSSQAFYVTTVPLPPALYLLGAGLLMLARRRAVS